MGYSDMDITIIVITIITIIAILIILYIYIYLFIYLSMGGICWDLASKTADVSKNGGFWGT